MVAALLRLRFRVLANTLRRNPVQLAAVVFGAVQAAVIVPLALGGMLFVSAGSVEAINGLLVVAGSALIAGWVIVPVLFDGVEQTLDPAKLARFPLPPGRLMVAMFVAGVAWIPGVTTLIVSVGTALAWREHSAAALAAVGSGVVATATCVAASRLTTGVIATLLRGRRPPRLLIVLVLVVLLVAPLVAGIRGPHPSASLVDLLGWSPLGAVWSVPGRIAAGDGGGAVGAAVTAIGTLAVTLVLWRLVLGASTRVSGGSRPRVRRSRLGAFAWLPSSPSGAITARALTYWLRDARQARQLLLIPFIPALMLLWWWLFDLDVIALAAGPFVATLVPLSMFAAISFDGTAFAAELGASVRGIDDRIGRIAAMLAIAVPSTLVVQLVVAVLLGRLDDVPALFGLSLGVLLVSTGVVAVSSAVLVVPVARAGRNPFSAPAGAATTSVVASYAVMGATIAVSAPLLAVGIVALTTRDDLLGWVTLAVALIGGVAVATIGIRLGGRLLDRRAPELLARLRLLRA